VFFLDHKIKRRITGGLIIKVALFSLILFAVSLISINAAGLSSARAVAMGGAYCGLAHGVYAPLYNPGNIGLVNYREKGLQLAGIGAQITNNSFTLEDYNNYTGAVLTENDKSVILGKIPSEGFQISAEVEAGIMSLSLGSIIISINGFAATESNLGKDIMELVLRGNSLNDSISLDGMYSEAIAYATAGISYGRSIYTLGTRQLAIGGTIKYIRGIAYERVTDISGNVVTFTTGFEGEGSMTAKTSTGGSGFGLDVGTSLRLNDNYVVGLAFSNLISSINWSNNTEEHYYHFRFDTLNLDNINDDSIIVTDDESRDIDGFQTSLPVVMRAGLANISGKLTWAIDYVQGFKLAPGSSSRPKLGFGAEYRLLSFLPLRAGYSMGGGKSGGVSGGLGLDVHLFYLDLAVSNQSTFNFEATKGLHVALSTGIRF
jgi:hypothetical protein